MWPFGGDMTILVVDPIEALGIDTTAVTRRPHRHRTAGRLAR